MRVVQYRGNGRAETLREQEGAKGYASGFKGLIDYIHGVLPTNEVIERDLRKTVPMFPQLAVRELVANALIHQDFFATGAGPMVEIFDDRIEITNPGEPLVDTDRFVDTPPRSRNETLASLMRRYRICEERGSGIDKVEQDRSSSRVLSTRLPPLRHPQRDDEHDLEKQVRSRKAKSRHRLSVYPGGRGSRRHRPGRSQGRCEAYEVPALLGRSHLGEVGMIRVLDRIRRSC